MISFKKLKEKNILHDTLHIGVSDELLLLAMSLRRKQPRL